ncbi:transposable element Tcb1 transposase [Trichonephila clavipes]|nr:transposable element Tcb1 transposase [Trichonephila clavipes]
MKRMRWIFLSAVKNPAAFFSTRRSVTQKRRRPLPWSAASLSPSFAKIGSRVGRNQTTVMQICDRWMQEGTSDRRGRSHPPQCTISREDGQIVRMAVTDHSVTSRTVTKHIEFVMPHSVSVRTIRRRL